jgi:3-hydroxyacyl-CoA dehydrogenase/enoyl-CoA hydratase/3-hydroxybutyryl-CoA epimerase
MSTNRQSAINYWTLESGVVVFQFDCPDSKMNVLSSRVMNELSELLNELAQDTSVKGLILTSAKAGCFFAGADINDIQRLQREASPVEIYQGAQLFKAVFDKLAKLPFRTVCAIDGLCLGGGLELALACKYRIASNDTKTVFGFPEVNIGVLPGGGGCVRAPALIGIPNALALIVDPDAKISAKAAWKMGLIDAYAPANELVARAEDIALRGGSQVRRARKPLHLNILHKFLGGTRLGRYIVSYFTKKQIHGKKKSKYPAPFAALDTVLASAVLPEEKAFDLESRSFAQLACGNVSKYLVSLYFADQDSKKAVAGIAPALAVKTVGVLGAGVMGAGIAQAALYSGYNVVLYDLFTDALDKGRKTIADLFASLVSKGKMSQEQVNAIMQKLVTTTSFEPLASCELVIEAIVEDLAIKKSTLAKLEKANPNKFIFASNTSSLDIDAMVADARNPELTGGLHFFNPVHKMPLVEVVRGAKTSDATVACLIAFAQRLKKTTVVTSNNHGFVVNRILTPYMNKAINLAEQGVSPEDIDKAMVAFGMPMGPIALIDTVGIDVGGKVAHVLNAAFGERMRVPDILSWIESVNGGIAAGNKKIRADNEEAKKRGQPSLPEVRMILGTKTGIGIYTYDKDGKRQGLNPAIVAQLNVKPIKKTALEIQELLTLVMINEAARCYSENTVASPSQLDLAMIAGTGFPPFRGGILQYADALGIKLIVDKLRALSQEHGENYQPCDLLVEMANTGRSFYSRS